MATLKTRITALERASTDTDQGNGFDFAPVMAYDEWCEAARVQQAALIKDAHENA